MKILQNKNNNNKIIFYKYNKTIYQYNKYLFKIMMINNLTIRHFSKEFQKLLKILMNLISFFLYFIIFYILLYSRTFHGNNNK